MARAAHIAKSIEGTDVMIRTSFVLLCLVLPATAALAVDPVEQRPPIASDERLTGATLGVTAVDTTLLVGPWGSGAPVNGQFETPGGTTDWNGWTSVDRTAEYISHWHVDTYNVVSGTYSAWCGDLDFPACARATTWTAVTATSGTTTCSGAVPWPTPPCPARSGCRPSSTSIWNRARTSFDLQFVTTDDRPLVDRHGGPGATPPP